jgi:hypothetical protein
MSHRPVEYWKIGRQKGALGKVGVSITSILRNERLAMPLQM